MGREIVSLSKDYSFEFFFPKRKNLDITDFKKVENYILINKIDIIINCAAYTNVIGAEKIGNKADLINYLAVKNLSAISKKFNCKFIHISTDYVFDGNKKTPYLESDSPNPINNYGSSKLKGEDSIIFSKLSNCIIIRTSWLYSRNSNSFLTKIIDKVNLNENIKVVSDQFGSPTYAKDLALAILSILNFENNKTEIYNFCNYGEISWYEFAVQIANKLNSNIDVLPIKDNFDNVKRPKYSALNPNKFSDEFGIQIKDWKSSLNECLDEINND